MAESDNLQIFNIEVPADVINDNAEKPRKSNKKLANETVVELPIGEPAEAEPPKEKPKREAQKKKPAQKRQTTQKKQTRQPKKAQTPKEEPEIAPPEVNIGNIDEEIPDEPIPEIKEDFSEALAEEPKPEPETEELSNTSKEVLAALEMISDEASEDEILLEPIEKAEEQKPAKPQGREAQKRKTKAKAPAKKLATPEEQKKAEVLRKESAKPPIREIQVPPPAKKKPKKQQSGVNTQKILSYIIPTQSDGMTEVIRKGIVIICIVVLLFSMGILIKSTRLEKKASKENAGNYFVNKYVYSYDINKNKESKKDKQQTENTETKDSDEDNSGEENK